ncbi:MAG: PepSY domain-containing protein [Clostridia bacterium]|nr:PepSY domain-containing protein [Clostridia bacterium]
MKKFLAATLVAIMVVMAAAGAMAQGSVSLEQAKQIALKRAGVSANEVRFNKAHQDWDDGRMVYELEFWKGNTEYDVDVDVATGRIKDFDVERHGYDYDDDDYDDFFDWFD